MLARGDLTDLEWRIIKGLLSSERGRKARPAEDNRRYIDGMLHVLRVVARGATCMSGMANGIRFTSVFGAGRNKAFGRSRGGFTTKIHARADGQGRPLWPCQK